MVRHAGLPGGQFHFQHPLLAGRQRGMRCETGRLSPLPTGSSANSTFSAAPLPVLDKLQFEEFLLAVGDLRRPVQAEGQFRLLHLDRGLRSGRLAVPADGQVEGPVLPGHQPKQQFLPPLGLQPAQAPLDRVPPRRRAAIPRPARGRLGAGNVGRLRQPDRTTTSSAATSPRFSIRTS